MRTIEEAIRAASSCLGAIGLEDPRMESEYLIAAFLGTSRSRLILRRQEPLAEDRLPSLQRWLRERLMRKPLAYVTGEQPFRDLNLAVSSDVLIPRPETELVVEQALRFLDASAGGAAVVDVGTGSGAIALSLCAHRRVQRVVAIDISPAALRVAKVNGGRNQALKIDWRVGHLLQPVLKEGLFVDLIVANLPYVRTDEFSWLEPELHWEPRLALDGGDDGLRLIEPCIAQAEQCLRPEGALLLEIGSEQAPAVRALFEKSRKWKDVQVFRDWSGLPRMVQGLRKDN